MIVITNIVALNKSPKGRFLKWLRMELGVEEVEEQPLWQVSGADVL